MILKAVLSVPAGAVITVLVAWGFAIWAPVPQQPTALRRGTHSWVAPARPGWPERPQSVNIYRSMGRTQIICSFTPELGTVPECDAILAIQCTLRVGLPLPAMEHGYWHDLLGGGVRLKRSVGATGLPVPDFVPVAAQRNPINRQDPRGTVPTRVLWPGFALNTCLFALLVFALWSVPGYLRRRMWGRGGRCVLCGYDLSGTVPGLACPECGKVS